MKILFISHDATRTGAPILLLRLIEQIKLTTDFEILILLKHGGELTGDFEKMGQTFVWNCDLKSESFINRLKNKAYKKIGIKVSTRQDKYRIDLVNKFKKIDIIFSNTVANAALLKNLSLDGKKVFSYIHELQMVTEMSAKPDEVIFLGKVSDKIFVPCIAVKEYLLKNYNFKDEKFEILKYIIPIPKIKRKVKNVEISTTKNDFLVGFGGTLHWRKGYEFLPLIAKKIITDNNITDIHFVWIGANINSTEFIILKNDLLKLNLFHFFTFLEPQKNIEKSLSELDIFVLPSREDAFPLIVLEAAFHEVPCIYFLNAGGIDEFSGNGAGIGVNYLDIESMCQKIINLKANEKLRRCLGKKAKEKIVQYSSGNKILDFITHLE